MCTEAEPRQFIDTNVTSKFACTNKERMVCSNTDTDQMRSNTRSMRSIELR